MKIKAEVHEQYYEMPEVGSTSHKMRTTKLLLVLAFAALTQALDDDCLQKGECLQGIVLGDIPGTRYGSLLWFCLRLPYVVKCGK